MVNIICGDVLHTNLFSSRSWQEGNVFLSKITSLQTTCLHKSGSAKTYKFIFISQFTVLLNMKRDILGQIMMSMIIHTKPFLYLKGGTDALS